MTEGKVVLLGPETCCGWAKVAALPGYAATVHLVLQDRVLASAIADQSAGATDDPAASGNCWFEIDVPNSVSSKLADCRVLVGESGTYLQDGTREGRAEAASSASMQPPTSYRDALDRGLSASDVIDLLYLDILRRPADKHGLRSHLQELESGRGSLEGFRRSLLDSAEYRGLSLRVRDAPGSTFARGIAYCSSTRKMKMERHAADFQRLAAPLRRKLLEFLPGLVAVPGAVETLLAHADKGLPERETFFLALSMMSHKPSLIVADWREAVGGHTSEGASPDDRDVTVTCDSRLFLQGWNKLECSPTRRYRWMEQVAIILNPRPERRLERLEVSVTGWYGDLDQTIAAVAGGLPMDYKRHDLEGGGANLIFNSVDCPPIIVSHVALVAAAAACPWRHDGTPDMRLLSCQVTDVTFQFEEKAA